MSSVEYTDKDAAIAAAMTHLKVYKLGVVYVQTFPFNVRGPIWVVCHHKPIDNYTPITPQTVALFGHLYGRTL